MKELYQRFNIDIDQEKAISIFRNKIENILCCSELGEKLFKDSKLSLHWELCNELGIEYENFSYSSGRASHIFNKTIDFQEYLFRLQVLLDILWNKGYRGVAKALGFIINKAIDTSPVDLGIRLKFYKKKGVQIYPSGSKLLDEKLVDDILGILNEKERKGIRLAFEKGLKEFLQARGDKSKFKNAIRDMQLACDELMHYVFKDKNVGLKHLFKNDRWQKIGLKEYQKQIFWCYNEFVDKLVKHRIDVEIDEADAESFIYLTGLLIRLVLLKSDYVKIK